MANVNLVCTCYLPFKIGLCWGELVDPWEFVGDVFSTISGAFPNENEGTNSTAFTFNVENGAVTSALCCGELLVDVESA